MTTQYIYDLVDTWNDGATTFTSIKMNVADSASNASSLLMDLQVGTVSKFKVSKTGTVTTPGSFVADVDINWTRDLYGLVSTSKITFIGDTILSRRAAANLRLGAVDAAGSAIAINSVATNQLTLASNHGLTSGAAVIITGTTAPSGTSLNTLYYARSISAAVIELYLTFDTATATSGTTGIVAVTTAGTSASIRLATPFQRLSPQDFTGTDIPGQPLLINGSRGTGTGPGGSIIFQVAPAGSTGATQNALATALTINSASQLTFAAGSASSPSLRFSTAGWLARSGNWAYSDGSNRIFEFNGGGSGGIFIEAAYGLGWVNDASGNPPDTILRRDAANTLALRNGTAAQLFRVYSTFNGTNDAYGAIGAAVNLDGTSGDANTLYIGSQKKGSPTALTKLAIQVDGTTRIDYNITNANFLTFASNVYTPNSIFSLNDITLGRYLSFGPGVLTGGSTVTMYSNTSGVLQLSSGTGIGAGFDRLQFGGSTPSFPALKRSTTVLQARLADDSAFAPVQGKLTTDTAYTAGAIVATGYLTLYDSTGTAYRVPCVV